MFGLVALDIVDDAFVVQNQNRLLQISKRTTFFLWYVCFNAFQKEYLRQNIETFVVRSFSEFADQHCYTQSIMETELHALTEMEGKSQSQQKKGQAVWKKQAIL